MVFSEWLRHDIKSGFLGYIVFNGDFVKWIDMFRIEIKGLTSFLGLSAVRDGTKGGVNPTNIFTSM